jgi:FMN phosphatase YigB (HAD superfamily)
MRFHDEVFVPRAELDRVLATGRWSTEKSTELPGGVVSLSLLAPPLAPMAASQGALVSPGVGVAQAARGARAAVRTVIFDCGNTLLEQRPCPVDVYMEVVRAVVGRELDPGAVAAAYRAVTFARPQSALALKSGDKSAYFDRYNRDLGLFLGLDSHYRDLNPALQKAFAGARAWQPCTDTRPALDALASAGVRLVVVANWDANLESVLATAGLRERFAGVYASASIGVEKPDPRVFAPVWRDFAAAPATSVYVGDDYALDVAAARGAGVRPLLLDRGGRYSGADCEVIASLAALPPLIASSSS